MEPGTHCAPPQHLTPGVTQEIWFAEASTRICEQVGKKHLLTQRVPGREMPAAF